MEKKKEEVQKFCQDCKFHKNKPSQCFNERWKDAFPLYVNRKHRCDYHEVKK